MTMPPEEESQEEEGADWTAEAEETAPEFMEPVVEMAEVEVAPGEEGVRKAREERDAKDTTLYRERTVTEEVVEEDRKPPRPPTRAERKAEKERLRLEREVDREIRRRDSWLRTTLAYKTFYDLVCNRVGVIIAGFGVAMILFTISYDWLQGESLSLGARHMTALIISLAVYFTGMGLEAMRILSPECEGLEAKALRTQADSATGAISQPPNDQEPIPMVPDDAVQMLLLNNGKDEED